MHQVPWTIIFDRFLVSGCGQIDKSQGPRHSKAQGDTVGSLDFLQRNLDTNTDGQNPQVDVDFMTFHDILLNIPMRDGGFCPLNIYATKTAAKMRNVTSVKFGFDAIEDQKRAPPTCPRPLAMELNIFFIFCLVCLSLREVFLRRPCRFGSFFWEKNAQALASCWMIFGLYHFVAKLPRSFQDDQFPNAVCLFSL